MVVVGVVAAIVVGVTGCASQAPAAPAGRFDFDFGHRAPHTAVPAPWAGGGDASVALGLLDELAVKVALRRRDIGDRCLVGPGVMMCRLSLGATGVRPVMTSCGATSSRFSCGVGAPWSVVS